MLFNKNKNKMIDIRELQKRGVVRIPKKNIDIPTDNEGFVELGQTQKSSAINTKSPTVSNTDFFGFANTVSQPTTANQQPATNFNNSTDSYNKREVDQKITDLDNKIYKLEQRLELLEKKLDINQPTNNVGVMGW